MADHCPVPFEFEVSVKQTSADYRPNIYIKPTDVPHTLQVSPRAKIENIHSCCKSFGYDTNDVILNIISNISELTDDDIVLIDELWNSKDEFQKKMVNVPSLKP